MEIDLNKYGVEILMDNNYICRRCGYATTCRSNLIKHLKRKMSCAVLHEDVSIIDLLKETYVRSYTDDDIKCSFCAKLLKSHAALCRHKKICKNNPKNEGYIVQLKDTVEELRGMVVQQQAVIQKLSQSQSPSVNHYGNINHGNQVNQVNHITINGLGKEDITHITGHPRFPDFMVKCIRDKVEGVCNYLVKKHFDPAHPENHNIKKTNRKDPFMECFDGRKWKVRHCEDILEDIFLNIQTEFANFVDEAFAENGGINRNWMDNFMKQVGVPLDWDLSNDSYTFRGEVSEENKKMLRKKIYQLACEYIYRHSKEV